MHRLIRGLFRDRGPPLAPFSCLLPWLRLVVDAADLDVFRLFIVAQFAVLMASGSILHLDISAVAKLTTPGYAAPAEVCRLLPLRDGLAQTFCFDCVQAGHSALGASLFSPSFVRAHTPAHISGMCPVPILAVVPTYAPDMGSDMHTPTHAGSSDAAAEGGRASVGASASASVRVAHDRAQLLVKTYIASIAQVAACTSPLLSLLLFFFHSRRLVHCEYFPSHS